MDAEEATLRCRTVPAEVDLVGAARGDREPTLVELGDAGCKNDGKIRSCRRDGEDKGFYLPLLLMLVGMKLTKSSYY